MAAKEEKDLLKTVARTRAALDRQKPVALNPEHSSRFRLAQGPKKLGEFATLVMCGPFGPTQYTICRPIGITDLSPDDWIIIPTDEVQSALARSEDPNKQEIDRLRSIYKTTELVNRGLLVKQEHNGQNAMYYQGFPEDTRAALLNEARARQKAAIAPLRAELGKLGEGSGQQKQDLNNAIQKHSNLLNFFEVEKMRNLEAQIVKILQDPELEHAAANAHPYTHRTLVGPYTDQPQVAIIGAGGYPLIDVLGAMRRLFTTRFSLTPLLDDKPSVRVSLPQPVHIGQVGVLFPGRKTPKGKKKDRGNS